MFLLFNNSLKDYLKEGIVVKNGNFLFYNSPVYQSYEGNNFLSWVDQSGNVVVRTVNKYGRTNFEVVHNHKDDILTDRGQADDHSAPAIFIDKSKRYIYLATAYHGSNLFIYRKSLDYLNDDFQLFRKIEGSYTYPRFLESAGLVVLLLRNQPPHKTGGDLVIFDHSDDFYNEKIILESNDGEVIYAGSPIATEHGFSIAYSTHNYKEKRLIGFNLLDFDLEKSVIKNNCDLSYLLDKDSYSNRPTGIGYLNGKYLIGTAYYKFEDRINDSEKINYSAQNTVLIVEGRAENCSNFNVVEKNVVSMPYYETSISIDGESNWIYFNKNKAHSNLRNIEGCFNHDNMIYPNMLEGHVFYASMNDKYEIRNFNNKVIHCNLNG